MSNLQQVANELVSPAKGILAADESTSTATKRLESVGVESTEENRRKYRQILFATDNIEKYLSGVILYDETIRQQSDSGINFAKFLDDKGIIPGIKVDKGKINLPNSSDEKITEGLDGLRTRLQEYSEFGAKFAKWRAVVKIDKEKDLPSMYSIYTNCHALARYAALCQEEGIVPIVEPEILMSGDHSIDDCYQATRKTLNKLFSELKRQRVDLSGLLLKTNMILDGKEYHSKANSEEVAAKTIQCFQKSVPAAVPGIVFLSGGQSEKQATQNLDAVNKEAKKLPWELSFSFGRALQNTALKMWSGNSENIRHAQEKFLQRCKLVSLARQGQYSSDLE